MEVRILCECGQELEFNCHNIWANGDMDFEMNPCPKCLEAAERDGFDEGQASVEGK